MPASFAQKSWTIYMPKETAGESPNTPVSPTREIATSGTAMKNDTVKNLAVLGVVGLAAQSAVGLSRSEIQATTGDEVLQNTVNNGILGLGYAALIAKTGLVGAAGLGVKGVFDSIKQSRRINRENQAIEFNRKLLGKRQSITGDIYD